MLQSEENKFILQIEQISEKIIRLKQIDSIHFYVILKDASTLFFRRGMFCWRMIYRIVRGADRATLEMELITITNPFSPPD